MKRFYVLRGAATCKPIIDLSAEAIAVVTSEAAALAVRRLLAPEVTEFYEASR